MNTGNLQRRWSAEMPQVYNKETRIVCIDIRAEKQKDMDGNDVDGYSFIQVEIDRHIDYGHIKSQLIEAGFAQKDEFGLLMNAVGEICDAIKVASTFDEFKELVSSKDMQAFAEFNEFRTECANAAKQIMKMYGN